MQSRDIVVLVLGVVLTGVFSVTYSLFSDLSAINLLFGIILILALGLLIALWILYKRIRESEEDLRKQDTRQTKLEEKLKIHEQLIDIKADIKELQKKVFRK